MQRSGVPRADGRDYGPEQPGVIAYALLILLVVAAAVGLRWLYLGWSRIW